MTENDKSTKGEGVAFGEFNPIKFIKENARLKSNGSIDWELLIPEDQLYLNTEVYKKNGAGDIRKLKEEDYKALLSEAPREHKVPPLKALKDLLELRGFESIKTSLIELDEKRTVAQTTIILSEVEGLGLKRQEVTQSADASPDNTHGFISSKYHVTTAENRSLARAIRTALGIHTVCKEELSLEKSDEEEAETGEFAGKGRASNMAAKMMKGLLKKLSKDESSFIKELYLDESYQHKDKELWQDITDIPESEQLTLLSRLQGQIKQLEASKAEAKKEKTKVKKCKSLEEGSLNEEAPKKRGRKPKQKQGEV